LQHFCIDYRQARLTHRETAATNIQRMIRGWLARLSVEKMKKEIEMQRQKVF
jgi:hypothetical protein